MSERDERPIRDRCNAYRDAFKLANGHPPAEVRYARGYYYINGVARRAGEVDEMTAVLRKRYELANKEYPALAAKLGGGWAVDTKLGGVRKGVVRVWRDESRGGRYMAEFANCVVHATGDAWQPEAAVAKALSAARRYADLTLSDIAVVEVGL